MWSSWSVRPLIDLVISYDLARYMDAKLHSKSVFLLPTNQTSTLLISALEEHENFGSDQKARRKSRNGPEMIEVLLKHGAVPKGVAHRLFGSWKNVLQQTYDNRRERDFLIARFPILKVFLRYGFTPSVSILVHDEHGHRVGITAADIIKLAFNTYTPPDAEEILSLLDGKKSSLHHLFLYFSTILFRSQLSQNGLQNGTETHHLFHRLPFDLPLFVRLQAIQEPRRRRGCAPIPRTSRSTHLSSGHKPWVPTPVVHYLLSPRCRRNYLSCWTLGYWETKFGET
jgi:hypothetical protein